MRTIAASEPGPSVVLVRTLQSYCSKIQRLEHKSPDGKERLEIAHSDPQLWNAGRSMGAVRCGFVCGRSYSGASLASSRLGMSATTAPWSFTISRPVSVTWPIVTASSPHLWKTRKTSSSRPFSATSSMRSCDSLSMIS